MNATVSRSDKAQSSAPSVGEEQAAIVRRHLRFGWWSMLIFLTMGLVLEALHGFKVQAYLSVMNETRRLMWTLAHAHGAILGLAHLGFAFTAATVVNWPVSRRTIASWCLIAASVLLPGGFLLGGVWVYAGDPGVGILLVPIGGVLLFAAVLLTACSAKHMDVKTSRVGGTRRSVRPPDA